MSKKLLKTIKPLYNNKNFFLSIDMGNQTTCILSQKLNHNICNHNDQWLNHIEEVWQSEYLPAILDAWMYDGQVTKTNPLGLACHVFYANKQAEFDARFGKNAHKTLMDVLSNRIQLKYNEEQKNASR